MGKNILFQIIIIGKINMNKYSLEKKGRGRPRSTDPKIKLDNFRLKTSTLLDIDLIAEEMNISKSKLLQMITEEGIKKYKEELLRKNS